VLVRGEARRGGIIVLQCVRDGLKEFSSLEIPEWMFDSHLCDQMKPTESPRVRTFGFEELSHVAVFGKDRPVCAGKCRRFWRTLTRD